MKITVIGAGNMGSAFVSQLVRAGHRVSGIGFQVTDAGGLKNARDLEPLAGLNIDLAYGAGQGTGIAPTWIRKA